MSNLPDWAGADIVYTRCYKINQILNERAYASQFKAAKGKKFSFRQDETVEDIIDALNKGDEERLKAHVLRHHDIVFG